MAGTLQLLGPGPSPGCAPGELTAWAPASAPKATLGVSFGLLSGSSSHVPWDGKTISLNYDTSSLFLWPGRIRLSSDMAKNKQKTLSQDSTFLLYSLARRPGPWRMAESQTRPLGYITPSQPWLQTDAWAQQGEGKHGLGIQREAWAMAGWGAPLSSAPTLLPLSLLHQKLFCFHHGPLQGPVCVWGGAGLNSRGQRKGAGCPLTQGVFQNPWAQAGQYGN